MNTLPLKMLHPDHNIIQLKLSQFRKLSTQALLDSLQPGREGALKAKPDGTVMDGHHRLIILIERGIDVDGLLRETI